MIQDSTEACGVFTKGERQWKGVNKITEKYYDDNMGKVGGDM